MKTNNEKPKGLTDEELISKYGNLKTDLEKKLKKVLKQSDKR